MKNILQLRSGLIVVFTWAILLVFINPEGDFAINDDWAYAHNVFALSEDGVLSFSDYPAMTLIGQTLIAAVPVLLFGFSFTVLRVLTLLLFLASALLFLRILRRSRVSEGRALLGTLLLMGCAPLLGISFSFMTEWYYLFFMLLSLLFFQLYFTEDKRRWLILALFFCVLTMLVRQTGLLLLLALSAHQVYYRKWCFKLFLKLSVLLMVGITVLIAYKYFRLSTGSGMGSYSRLSAIYSALKTNTVEFYLQRVGSIFLYLGLFTIPLLPLTIRRLKSFSKKSVITLLIAFLPVLGVFFVWQQFPTGNLFANFGLGPRLLKDAEFGLNPAFHLSTGAMNLLKIMSTVSAVLTLNVVIGAIYEVIFQRKRKIQPDHFNAFLLILVAAELAYLLINPVFFDRYLIPVLVVLILVLCSTPEGAKVRLLWVSGILSLVLSAVWTHDYMNWHRARHKAVTFLQRELKVPATKIDGGYEFNGWHRTAPIGINNYKLTEKSWWFVADDEYLISSGPFPGYESVKCFRIGSILVYGNDSVCILRRSKS